MGLIIAIIIGLIIIGSLSELLEYIFNIFKAIFIVIIAILGISLAITILFFISKLLITCTPTIIAKIYLLMLIPITIIWYIYKLYQKKKLEHQKKIMIENHYFIANTIASLLPDLGMATELEVYREISQQCRNTLQQTSVSKTYMENCLEMLVKNSKAKVILEIEKDRDNVGKKLYQTLEPSGMNTNIVSSQVIELEE